jgi:hypothetical protein
MNCRPEPGLTRASTPRQIRVRSNEEGGLIVGVVNMGMTIDQQLFNRVIFAFSVVRICEERRLDRSAANRHEFFAAPIESLDR